MIITVSFYSFLAYFRRGDMAPLGIRIDSLNYLVALRLRCILKGFSEIRLGFSFFLSRHGLLIVFDSPESNLIKECDNTLDITNTVAHLFLECFRLTGGRCTLDSVKICLKISQEFLELRKKLLEKVLVIGRKLGDEVRVGKNIRHTLGNDLAACFLIGHFAASVLCLLCLNQIVNVLTVRRHSIKNYFS